MDLMDNALRCPQSHSLHIDKVRTLVDVVGDLERQGRVRLQWVEAYRALGDAGAVCRRFGISRPTLRKWLRRYEVDGEAGLRAHSRRPHHSPGSKVGQAEEDAIVKLRRDRRLGVRRLRSELRRLNGLILSATTIHKVLVHHELGSLPGRRRGRHQPKRYSRPIPGDRIQMDTCKIWPGLYQYAAIDDCSRYLVLGLARRASAAATSTFLDRVLEEMPFAIQRIQTDRGAEFFAEAVQRRLMDWCIKFRPIRPRSPQLNGKVERVQRTVLDEFWTTVDPKAEDIEEQLAIWVQHYNWDRTHEALGNLTPIDRICERAAQTPLWDEVCIAYDVDRARIRIREYVVDRSLRKLKRCL
jgi:transposase InsO family protein